LLNIGPLFFFFFFQIPVTSELTLAGEAPQTEAAIRAYMLSRTPFQLTALENAIETAKSVILGVALVEGSVTALRANALSRLELDHQVWQACTSCGGTTSVASLTSTAQQIQEWGNVEWAHDIELADTTARLAACALTARAVGPA
jgi:ATP synthase F1 complex assembly factor 2